MASGRLLKDLSRDVCHAPRPCRQHVPTKLTVPPSFAATRKAPFMQAARIQLKVILFGHADRAVNCMSNGGELMRGLTRAGLCDSRGHRGCALLLAPECALGRYAGCRHLRCSGSLSLTQRPRHPPVPSYSVHRRVCQRPDYVRSPL